MRKVLLAVSMLALSAIAAVEPASRPAATQVVGAEKVSANRFDELRNQSGVIILDVRMPGEFDAGHIAGATNLPWGGYLQKAFDEQAAKLDPSKTYLLHCATGKRSELAGRRLAELGLTHLYDLDGGMRAWVKAGKPVEKPAK